MSINYEEMSWSDVRDLFRNWRENKERKSDDVIQLWIAVLEDKVHKVGDERPMILEQVVIAALDVARHDIAAKCIKQLSAEFPGSLRVQKLKAMRLEALERYGEALDVLDGIIKKDETNAGARKRKVAIYKATLKRTDAIRELCEYVKRFMCDREAWHELGNLYLIERDYAKAVFCLEELILHNPHNHLHYERIAEIRYSMGGLENIEIAKDFNAQAVKLNGNSLRALYGLYLCCNFIANSRAAVSKRKEAQKLAQWALEQVKVKTKKSSKIKNNEKYIDALEGAFGGMEIKSN